MNDVDETIEDIKDFVLEKYGDHNEFLQDILDSLDRVAERNREEKGFNNFFLL